MAGQQQQIIDTIFNLKRRLLRNDDSSDAEETDTPYNNRMRSLKRKAQYIRSGKPESAADPPPYKKRIEHAGYRRYILQHNPPRFDPDGDVVEPGDEYEDEGDLSPVEENPYGDIKLEVLLAPLTSAADLPTHPSYSVAYTSKHLTNLTSDASAISRKEQILLSRAKNLFTKLVGDPSFVPDDVPNLNYGENLQDPWADVIPATKPQHVNGHAQQAAPLETTENGDTSYKWSNPDVVMEDAEQQQQRPNGVPPPTTTEATDPAAEGRPELFTNGDAPKQDTRLQQEQEQQQQQQQQPNGSRRPSPTADDASSTASHQTSHRMTTRARAQAASDHSPPPSPSTIVNQIHPLFTYPTSSLPDRDFGLPPAEAEDTRMLLLAFVQKQEEIARAGTDLYLGMLQGERMRQNVYSWSKAEGHVGEMSDGEDWYDKEEWGLTEDLVKGRDEEEDESAVQGKKSTRQRRKPDKDDR